MDTYIYIYIAIFVVFIDVTLQVLQETEYIHSGCYGNLHSSLMKANCSVDEAIAPIEVRVGSKTNDSGCPAVAQTDFTSTEFQRCCYPASNDGCIGVYQSFGNNSNLYKDDCVGRSQCSPRPIAFMDTLHLGCNQSVYLPQTNFMYMNYYCISESRIGRPPTVSLQSNTVGSFLYLQGQSYPSEITTSFIICSVETQCENTIIIYAVDIRLNSSSGSCNQRIDITDGVTSKSITCNDNNDYVISTLYTSVKNYFTLSFNSSVSSGGFFWIGITASNGSVTLNCPVQHEIYQCETTTEEQTTTTSMEETTSDVTSVETTNSDVTTVETTLVTENKTEGTTDESRIQTTTTNDKPAASESSEDPPVIIIVIIVCVVVVLAVVAVIAILIYKRCKKKKSEENENVEGNQNFAKNVNLLKNDLLENRLKSTRESSRLVLPPISNSTANNSVLHHNNGASITGNIICDSKSESEKNKKSRKKKKKKKRKNEIKETDNKTNLENELDNVDVNTLSYHIYSENEYNTRSENSKKKKKKRKSKTNRVEPKDNENMENKDEAQI